VHDYAAGVMAAFASVVEHIGRMRGLPPQTMQLNRRHCGLALNSMQIHFLNGYSTILDAWGVGPDNGTYRTKDGRHITIIGLHAHLRDALLNYFQCPNNAQAIQAAALKKTAQQIEDELAALNLPGAMVRTREEYLSHPQGAASAKLKLIDILQKGNAKKRALGKARHRPLEGVRVLELTQVISGPTVARLLAEQGAEVIKVNSPMMEWVTPLWLEGNWGKKNITLDINSRSGRRRFNELLANADVLVDSNRPDALIKIGLDEHRSSGHQSEPDLRANDVLRRGNAVAGTQRVRADCAGCDRRHAHPFARYGGAYGHCCIVE
jgi:crotonobetainyl-CoA:carnitine CoA-transferase CaiB-like acyl-CoA transferase